MKYFLPGETVCDENDFIRGHGTQVLNDKLISSYFGTQKIINKLVTIEPCIDFRYSPEVGDVVIGRVKEIFNKKWKIEMNSKTDVSLNLSAINLPGVAQRRKLESDEISMRDFFDIDDLLVAEVQKVTKNGSASLHTRNEKYKKLEKGVLVIVPPNIVPQMKTRFINYSDLEVIVGCNGYVWISQSNDTKETFMRAMKLYNSLKSKIDLLEPFNIDEML